MLFDQQKKFRFDRKVNIVYISVHLPQNSCFSEILSLGVGNHLSPPPITSKYMEIFHLYTYTKAYIIKPSNMVRSKLLFRDIDIKDIQVGTVGGGAFHLYRGVPCKIFQ